LKVPGWKNRSMVLIFIHGKAECLARKGRPMALNFIKIALLAGLVIVTVGVFPDRRRGGIIAIATCLAAAVLLHFIAP